MASEQGPAPRVGVVMGSRSDWETMRHAAELLEQLGVPHEVRVVSAHRTPYRLVAYAREAEGRGLDVLIAGAGGAAHLPGMLAAITPLPVLGVPVESRVLRGVDSLLVDRPDAQGGAGRDPGDRRRRGGQRGPAGGGDPRAVGAGDPRGAGRLPTGPDRGRAGGPGMSAVGSDRLLPAGEARRRRRRAARPDVRPGGLADGIPDGRPRRRARRPGGAGRPRGHRRPRRRPGDPPTLRRDRPTPRPSSSRTSRRPASAGSAGGCRPGPTGGPSASASIGSARSRPSSGSACRPRPGTRSDRRPNWPRQSAAVGLPMILKTATSGYDGKGQVRVDAGEAPAAAWAALDRGPLRRRGGRRLRRRGLGGRRPRARRRRRRPSPSP